MRAVRLGDGLIREAAYTAVEPMPTDEQFNVLLHQVLYIRARLEALIQMFADEDGAFLPKLDQQTDAVRRDFQKRADTARLEQWLKDYEGRKQ